MEAAINNIESKEFFAKRFGLWLSIGAMIMMFAGFTSAFIVKKGDAANWTTFTFPVHFYISTLLILMSSATMHFAYRAFKNNRLLDYKKLLLTTLVLGTGFIITQVLGWSRLVADGIILTEEVSGAFFYVISGTHAVHVLGGLVILMISFFGIRAKLKNPVYDLTMDVSPKRKFRVELVATYWHFVDALWIYLFLFLLYNNL